jgi:hypothetical protein
LKAKNPFATWRVLCQDGSRRFAVDNSGYVRNEIGDRDGALDELDCDPLPDFDELVVGDTPCLVHLERMDTNSLFVSLGDVSLSVWRDKAGKTRVLLQEGTFDAATQELHEYGWTAKKGRKR